MHAGNFQIQNGIDCPGFPENEKGLFLHGGRFQDGQGSLFDGCLEGRFDGFGWDGGGRLRGKKEAGFRKKVVRWPEKL